MRLYEFASPRGDRAAGVEGEHPARERVAEVARELPVQPAGEHEVEAAAAERRERLRGPPDEPLAAEPLRG